jgi:uncharacterized damage-inducible protein DinB
MTEAFEVGRSLAAYNQWANARILNAAEGLKPEGWAQLQKQFEHLLSTQLYWYANWTGSRFAEPSLADLAAARDALFASDAALKSFALGLDDAGWRREETWWKEWGYEKERMSVGDSLIQVCYHGMQHRAEIALVLSVNGCSPGDMDYLNFKMNWQ